MNDLNLTMLPTQKTDVDKAAAYRAELAIPLATIADILNRARREGLIIGFNVSADQFGVVRVAHIDVTKPL